MEEVSTETEQEGASTAETSPTFEETTPLTPDESGQAESAPEQVTEVIPESTPTESVVPAETAPAEAPAIIE